MSGGYFNYRQYVLNEIIDEIERVIYSKKSYPEGEEFPNFVLEEFRKTVKVLKEAEARVHEIDWLLSGDTSNESFIERLNEQLKELED